VVVLTVARLASDGIPWEAAGDAAARLAASSAELFTARRLELGPTAAGVPLVAASLVFLAAQALVARRLWPLALAPLALAAWWLHPLVIPRAGTEDQVVRPFGSLLFLGLAMGVVVALPPLARAFSHQRLTSAPVIPARGPARLAAAASVALFALYGAAASATMPWRTGPPRRSVLVYNRGGFDWERPVFGNFGGFSSGMFGLLPLYLRHEGWSVNVLDTDCVDAKDLEGVGVFVLINCPKLWAAAERSSVLDHVARGGSLLVLGDHTDVFGLMGGFNSLLAECGVEFRFDSAYHARETWAGCLSIGSHAVAQPWARSAPSLGIGASLECRPPARPLLWARYAHSDHGVRENEVGAFLGDYRWEDEERLGDLVVAARIRHGRGRIVVYGDTSAFQNSALPYSEPHEVVPLLAWLAEPEGFLALPWLDSVLPVLALVLAGSWLLARAEATLAGLAFAAFLGLSATTAAAQARWTAPLRTTGEVALVGDFVCPAVGHYDAGWNPVGPLYSTLARAGFIVRRLERWDSEALRGARLLALVAPRRRLSSAQLQDLLAYVRSGGLIILAAGAPDAEAVRPLLEALALEIEPSPLGRLPQGLQEREWEPRFLSAWPVLRRNLAGGTEAIAASDAEVEVLYRHGEHVTALFRRSGRGGLLLFADSRFFSCRNIEDVSGYWRGNLFFLQEVLRRFAAAAPESVEAPFPNPRLSVSP
jgi:hypothetical protein